MRNETVIQRTVADQLRVRSGLDRSGLLDYNLPWKHGHRGHAYRLSRITLNHKIISPKNWKKITNDPTSATPADHSLQQFPPLQQ
ncbi:hypothetical protein E2C01_039567 [Portunus trituberculatus]|uniref:Uncharacterized protein n=1 Tax=Portunus trituberculatus TaxID=210409 RepID=A0A5B7FH64_PORTR|nr:hypothetical protein [Portunus trituberculatus]